MPGNSRPGSGHRIDHQALEADRAQRTGFELHSGPGGGPNSIGRPVASPSSIDARARGFDDGRPLADFGLDVRGALLGRARRRLGAEAEEALPDAGIVQSLYHLGIEPGDDLFRRSSGRQDGPPGIGLEAGKPRFGEGGYIGHGPRAFRTGDRDRLHLARADLRLYRWDVVEEHGHSPPSTSMIAAPAPL